MLALALAGCGSVPAGDSPDAANPLNGDSFIKTVVLDWTGGESDVAANPLGPISFSTMRLSGGTTLAEIDSDEFREDVRAQVELLLSALEPAQFVVINGEAEDYPNDTAVFFTNDIVPGGGLQVGQTHLDQCDLESHGSVVVWVGTLLSVANGFEYNQWVNALSNVAAHEIGHTVGFFHPETIYDDLTEYEESHDIMMGTHNLVELVSEQAFLIHQDTCPEEVAAASGGVAYQISSYTAEPIGLSSDRTLRATEIRFQCCHLDK